MLPGIHLRVRCFDLALLIDQIADAIRVTRLGIRAGTICEAELAIGVA